MTFRKTIFWLHLAAGVSAGLVIGIMSFTGAVLAFEKQIIARAERDVACVTSPTPGAPCLPLDELQEKFREAQPGIRPTAISVSADPAAAVTFTVGREGTYYLNLYTGEVRSAGAQGIRTFMRQMEDWHRWLARSGDSRTTGRAITGACNAAFFFLAVSGLYLWWPRKWRTKGLKRSLWFVRDATGHARNWNWHNMIGFWFWPVLIVLTASGIVMSYRWANNLVYQAAGETPPAQGAPNAPPLEVSQPVPGTRPLGHAALLATAQKAFPAWETITLRLGGPRGADRAGPAPVMLSIKEPGAWPRTASTALTLDPFTGTVLKREGFADLTTGRQARTWLRFLHTGEALGLVGQFVAGLASIGGCFLVYTGWALAWRRFFGRKPASTQSSSS